MQKQVYITTVGKSMMLDSLDGKTITFTNFAVGKGTINNHSEANIVVATELNDPVSELSNIPISSGIVQGNYVRLTGGFSSDDVGTEFNWSELGVYACGTGDATFSGDGTTTTFTIASTTYTIYYVEETIGGNTIVVSEEDYSYDGVNNAIVFDTAPQNGALIKVYFPDLSNKKLFAYGYDWKPKKVSPTPISGDTRQEYAIEELLTVDDSAQIEINTSGSYATQAELDAHLNDFNNPHKVNASQLNLGSSANRTIIDGMVPSFTEPSTLSTLQSGENLSTLFGKIAAAVKYIITAGIAHITDMNNPHQDNLSMPSGTIPINKGGTGSNGKDANLIDFWQALIRNSTTSDSNRNLMIGTYVGTGTNKRAIETGMNGLTCVFVCAEYGFIVSQAYGSSNEIYWGLALSVNPLHDYTIPVTNDGQVWRDGYAIFINYPLDGTFYVSTNSGFRCHMNDDGVRYYFIAIKSNTYSGYLN